MPPLHLRQIVAWLKRSKHWDTTTVRIGKAKLIGTATSRQSQRRAGGRGIWATGHALVNQSTPTALRSFFGLREAATLRQLAALLQGLVVQLALCLAFAAPTNSPWNGSAACMYRLRWVVVTGWNACASRPDSPLLVGALRGDQAAALGSS